MSRFLRGSCIGLLALLFLVAAGLTVVAVLFQQSQAVESNLAVTSTPLPQRATIEPVPSQMENAAGSESVVVSTEAVIIQIETATASDVLPAAPVQPTFTPTTVNTASSAESVPTLYTPRHSGTSSYPLTVTAEVQLGQTHVAAYQSDVSATRTMIAAESAVIFATLTAEAPFPTLGAP